MLRRLERGAINAQEVRAAWDHLKLGEDAEVSRRVRRRKTLQPPSEEEERMAAEAMGLDRLFMHP